jgi:hypothetical protein
MKEGQSLRENKERKKERKERKEKREKKQGKSKHGFLGPVRAEVEFHCCV